jgi:hypothetical protein
MSVASATNHKKHHNTHHHSSKPKPKPKTKTKSAGSKTGSNPGGSLCTSIEEAQSNSSNLGTALEKSIAAAETSGSFASAQAAMLASINAVISEEGTAESDFSSAPANVQTALKDLFGFFGTLKTDVANATSTTGLLTSFEALGTDTQLKSESLTVANYVSSVCGTPPTTTTTLS